MTDPDLLLKDFRLRTALVTEDHTPDRARLPVVDAHNHLRHALDNPAGLIALMDALHIRAIVDLDGGWGEQLEQHLSRLEAPYPDRFAVFAWVDWSQVEEPDFGETWSAQLCAAVRAGAPGLEVFNSLALGYRDQQGNLIPVDVLAKIYHENPCKLIPGIEL